MVGATLCYGINVNEIKSNLTHLNGVQITSLSFMFLFPASLIYLIYTGFTPAVENPNWPFHFGALALLGIIGTAFAMLLMNSLIRYTSTIFAASVTYIIPIFAILWGIIDDEQITLSDLLFMAVILLGVYLINRNRRKQTVD